MSEGQQVHIQLAPLADCGVTPLTQISPRSRRFPEERASSAARTESLAPGQITLTIDFK